MAFTYGYETDSLDEPLVKSLAELVKLLNDGLAPERNAMLTAFPFRGYISLWVINIPTWFPGTTFKRDALRSQELSLRSLNGPFEYVRKSREAGSFANSMVSDLLDKLDGMEERALQEKMIKECAATVYIAGYDTSAATLLAFILAMMLYPEAQHRAQAEIDSVLTQNMFPDFSHRKSLPYVEAVLRETMRWHSVTPLALPHMTCRDDVFEGYFIPKGTMILPNVWEIHHEENGYPDPYVFNPERHLTEDGTVVDNDPLTSRVAFGFGRRHCPGKWVADSILWMGIVSILAVLRIDKAKDGLGRDIEVEPKFTAGVIRRPLPYSCLIACRSASRECLVRASYLASYMARTQADADVTPKHRQRSNTTAFSSFTSGWRRPRLETVSTPTPQSQPQALPFDALVEALSPPAVPSLTHARSLAASITSQSPLPKAAVLNSLLGSLCSVDSPPQLQCTGYEIMASYWERYEGKVTTSDRLAHCFLLLQTSWSPEIGDARLRALRALTKGGSDAFGIEIHLLNLLKSSMDGAFDAYLCCDLSERVDHERSIELVAAFVSCILEHPETVARISEGDLASILQFYASLVSKTLDIPATFPTTDATVITSPVGLTEQSGVARAVSNGHKRHSSSVSLRSVTPSAVHPSRHPAELMTTIYLDHLHSQLKSLAPKTLTLILPLLFRAQAFFASPLPRLSVMSGRPRGPVGLEERIQKMLHSLFSGPYGASCMMILKRHLFATDQTLDPHNLATSFGAHRTLRFDIRQVLFSKMARAYITRSSTLVYAPSGAPSHMDLEKDLMERAWLKDELSGWDLLKLGRMLCKSTEAWAERASVGFDEASRIDGDRILDEAAGTLKDIFQEFDEREDNVDLDEEEASITGETLQHLTSFVRPLKNPDDTPMIIPLSQPSDAPTPFLRTLISLLARDHSTYMNPSLSTTLLSIADHLADTDTVKLPAVMFEQHDLSPASPDWLRNWESILSNTTIFGLTHPLTRLEVVKALEAIYDSLKDMHSYRMDLAELVFKFCQRDALESLDTSANVVMGRILADEVVLRTVNRRTPSAEDSSSPSRYTSTQAMVELLRRVASDGVAEDDGDTASTHTIEMQSPSPLATFSAGASNTVTPVLSRRQSDYRNIAVRDSGLPSVMSLLSTLAGSRSHSQNSSQDQPDNPIPPLASSPSPEPTFSRASLAVISLVAIFGQLAFTPYSLTRENVDFSIAVFRIIVQMVTEAKCPRARLLALQFLMRLRADRDHRVYFTETQYDSDGLSACLACLIGRAPNSPHQDERGPFVDASQDEFPLRRTKGAQERDGRRSSRGGRGFRPSHSTPSRSRSRAPLPVSPSQSAFVTPKWKEALWSVPESLPFTAIDTDTASEGIVSYDPVQESPRVLPIDTYLSSVLVILEKEKNWDILSYVLCHLPVQLSNKHFFCGPKCRVLITRLVTVICSGVTVGDLGSSVEQWPAGLKARDAQGLAYRTLSVLISYKRCFDVPLRHALVDVLREGLNGQPSTITCCLHALTLSAFELTSSVKRSLPPLLEKLSQIMSNPDMAVHILSFLSIIGSIPELHANLREDNFKMVFGVALQYLQHHNRPGATPVISWAMSQYVRMISFYVVYVWFLSVRLPDRPRHIPYITRQLLLANEERSEIDEPTEVCFDWLARYTYASADPRPANSVLSEIVMNPTTAHHTSSEPAIGEKSWVMGNAIVTIRALARLGWIEVISRRPSGFTKFICKLENVPLVGPGEVEPDMVSLPAGLLMEREVAQAERPDPSEETEQSASGISDMRDLVPPPSEGPPIPAPDPITGYVWSKTAPSQRRKQVMVDPAFLPFQLSSYPSAPNHRRIIDESALPALFRNLDRTPVIDTHKVGIMYVAPGQTDELEILRNTHGSPAYTRFLEGIGRLINLRGQVDIYAGGLNPDEDGEYAYAWWDDIGQLLFHTATMMPNAIDDEYCVNKKRHIGNDYVRIVWNDGGRPYRFDTLATQFQFMNIVIEPHSLGAIAAFSNFRGTAASPPVDTKVSPSHSPLLTPSGPGMGTPTPSHEAENEYFKVTVQRASGMKDFTPIGYFKLISAEKLPLLVRQLTLLGDWFANVFEKTERDEVEVEVITNWRQRLQVVKRFMKNMEKTSGEGLGTSEEGGEGEGEGVIGQEWSRNFTTVY
ncbi:hypothetical protein JVU11DRAFT_8967 [Chiua virens]|nr:hypothetical protein JVU11DRAFT_8967 [Chiua virens]